MKHLRWVILLLLLGCTVIILNLNQFAFPREVDNSDLLISHFPNAVYVQNALKQWGEIPLWSNNILGGYPFISNPLSGLWYLPGWLVFLLPLPLGFNLTIIIHLVFGGTGMYLWQRDRGLGWLAAVVAAILFASMPKLMAHYAAGHISLVYAVCWTPWLLLSVMKARNATMKEYRWWLPGLLLGMVVLADIRWAAYGGLLVVGYSVALSLTGVRWSIERLSKLLGRVGLIAISAVIIALPMLLLLTEYASLSTRSLLTPEESFAYSLPPEKLLGILIPDFLGYAEWIVYPGAVGALALVYSFAVPGLRKKSWPWILLAFLSLVYSLGSSIPFLMNLADIPGWGLLRVPPRALMIWGVALAVVVAQAIDYLWNGDELPKFDPFFFLVPIMTFVLLMLFGLRFIEGDWIVNFVWGSVASVLGGILILAREKKWINSSLWAIFMVVYVFIDLNGANWQSIQYKPKNDVLAEGLELALWISDESAEKLRVYSPSYSIPQHTAAVNGMELVDGVDPMQLMNTVSFAEKATGVPVTGYSVTLPPFENGDPQIANQSYVPDAKLLGLLNVKYVAAEFGLTVEGLNFVDQFGQARLYENTFFRPRAWLTRAGDAVEVFHAVSDLEWSPNKIEIRADGPGVLVLSEVNYPGWHVTVDGKKAKIVTMEGLFRSVDLPSGSHQVVFQYFPWQIPVGICGMCLCLGYWFVVMKRRVTTS